MVTVAADFEAIFRGSLASVPWVLRTVANRINSQRREHDATWQSNRPRAARGQRLAQL